MAMIWHSPSCTFICELDDTLLVPHQAAEFMLGEKLLFRKLLSSLSAHQGKTLVSLRVSEKRDVSLFEYAHCSAERKNK